MQRILCVPCARNFIFPVFGDQPAVCPFTGNLGCNRAPRRDYLRRRRSKTGPTRRRRPLPRAGTHWFRYQDFLTEQLAQLLGAKPVACGVDGLLTTNLHLLFVSFYRPTEDALQDHGGARRLSVRPLRGRDAGALPRLRSRRGGDPPQTPGGRKHTLRHDDILAAIRENKDSWRRLCSGRELLHRTVLRPRWHRGCGPRGRGHLRLQLAHATGNVPLALHDWNVDYACFCLQIP